MRVQHSASGVSYARAERPWDDLQVSAMQLPMDMQLQSPGTSGQPGAVPVTPDSGALACTPVQHLLARSAGKALNVFSASMCLCSSAVLEACHSHMCKTASLRHTWGYTGTGVEQQLLCQTLLRSIPWHAAHALQYVS